MRSLVLAAILTIAALGAACGDDSPTTPTPTGPTTSEFKSRLQVSGSASRSFTTSAAGTLSVTLNEAGAAGTRVGLAIGVPNSTGLCSLTSSIITTASSTPQFSPAIDQGSYCVSIYDPGTLTTAVDFTITIVFP